MVGYNTFYKGGVSREKISQMVVRSGIIFARNVGPCVHVWLIGYEDAKQREGQSRRRGFTLTAFPRLMPLMLQQCWVWRTLAWPSSQTQL